LCRLFARIAERDIVACRGEEAAKLEAKRQEAIEALRARWPHAFWVNRIALRMQLPPPKTTPPPDLLDGLDFDREEDRVRFRLRVFRRYERLPQEALLDEAFAIAGERLPRATSVAAICKTIAKFWIDRAART
jgi:hypothetical protein